MFPLTLCNLCLQTMDRVVWRLQGWGLSKKAIGFFLYGLGTLLGGVQSLPCLVLIGIDLPNHIPLLRWAYRHVDEPTKGVLPIEIGALAYFATWLLFFPAVTLIMVLLVGVLLWVSPASVPGIAPPPAWTLHWPIQALFGHGAEVLFWLLRSAGLFALCCRVRPMRERFSFTRWLAERRAGVLIPVHRREVDKLCRIH